MTDTTVIDTTAIIEKITPIFQELFEIDTLELTEDLTADSIEGWDSLAHIHLIVAIESEFSIRFATSEIANLKNVGHLASVIQEKIS